VSAPAVGRETGIGTVDVGDGVELRYEFLAHHTADEVRAGLALSPAADPDPDLFTRLRPPTLLVVGNDDFSLAGSGVEELLRLLPDGRGVVVPRAGHLPFVDEPPTFQSAVAAFVATTGPGGQT
jgi:pimeloyl-ACP methyl ester carboxylesterase